MVAAQSITAPADLLRVPLVHLSSRPNAWRDWLAAHGLGGEVLAGTQADELARAIEILRSAPGAALLPRSLIRSALQRGERSEEHTSELQSLMRISYAVFCLKKQIHQQAHNLKSVTLR